MPALKIGLVDKSLLSVQEVETLADLPAREVLLGQLLGLLLSPATKLVRLLNEPGSALARLLNAKEKTMPVESEKPAPTETPVAESIAAEAAGGGRKTSYGGCDIRNFVPLVKAWRGKNKNCPDRATVDLNCAEASVHGNWRKTKWQQTLKKWWRT